MKCCICNNEIDKQYTPQGEMYWDKGNNPAPISTNPEDRCCNWCNTALVLPTRMSKLENNKCDTEKDVTSETSQKQKTEAKSH